jgi:2-polyprenyl-3-methyl-5-hydroxy-6-metoxy-1,4-benzoquinol methylase
MTVETLADRPRSEHGVPLCFGVGLYPEEEQGWRWMGPSGDIQVDPGALPARINFEVTCAPQSFYDRFPITLNIRLGRDIADRLTFQKGGQVRTVQIPLSAIGTGAELRLESSGSFVPAEIGLNGDVRRLSVRVRNVRLEPGDGRDCPVCGGPWAKAKFVGPLGRTGGSSGRTYDLVECTACGLIYLSPLPLKQEFDDLYIHNTQFDSEVYTGKRAHRIVEFFEDRLAAMSSHIGAANLRILELGGGLSWMCRAAKLRDPSTVTVAQDISQETVNTCTWVDHFYLGEIEDVMDRLAAHGPYHIISMTHVIEHVPEPAATLALCREVLRPGGFLFVTAPYRPKVWEPARSMAVWESWSYNHVPAHLQYFHEQSMKTCAARANLRMKHFNDREDDDQAFETWLARL